MHATQQSTLRPAGPTTTWRERHIGPVFALLLLAPVVAELLYGAIRVSTIFILIPEIMTWGCSALLIRESVRRWGKGWKSMLVLGLALAVAEEWVMQQTSISPLVGQGDHGYGRVWGVNSVYFLWALGYESVWVVVVPVQLTELLFPQRRIECWLRARGFVTASGVFLLGACLAWYGWTQRARVKLFHIAPYSPPLAYLMIGLATILGLILTAHLLPSTTERGNSVPPRLAPSPPVVGAVICAMGTPWAAFVLLGWGVGAFPSLPFPPVLAFGLAWAGLTLFLVQRWSSSVDWRDTHRFALVFSGVLACMLGGFVVFAVGGALRIDWMGKPVLDSIAVAWLISLGGAMQRRKNA